VPPRKRGEGGRRGGRTRRAGHREPEPPPHRGARHALGEPPHARQRGGARPGAAPAGGGQGPHGETGPPPHTPPGHGDGERLGGASAAADMTPARYPGTTPAARLADPEKPWQADQKSVTTLPSGADGCLVPEAIPPLGGPLGAHGGMLRRVVGHRYHSHLGAQINCGIDS
jgi:hypothetical protein